MGSGEALGINLGDAVGDEAMEEFTFELLTGCGDSP